MILECFGIFLIKLQCSSMIYNVYWECSRFLWNSKIFENILEALMIFCRMPWNVLHYFVIHFLDYSNVFFKWSIMFWTTIFYNVNWKSIYFDTLFLLSLLFFTLMWRSISQLSSISSSSSPNGLISTSATLSQPT